jgi:alkylation response protein AidB-like acyl-CoA dehydrogenase
MDFAIPDDERALAELVRTIAGNHLTQQRLRALDDADDRIDRGLWEALAGAYVLRADLGVLGDTAVLIELGRLVAPIPYATSIAVGARALAAFGRPELAAKATDGALLVTTALTEDLSDGSAGPLSRAEPATDGWVLSGAKVAVPHGSIADLLLVPASSPDGPRVFLVRPSDDGVSIERQTVVDGNSEATLELRDVRLGADAVLGDADVPAWLEARETLAVCAHQLGVLERALDLTAAYAREREQFGKPIGSFQAVGQRLADAYIDVEAVRLTTWEAAWRIAQGLPASAELATAKFWAADAGHRVAHTAVHVHGGTGIDMDGAVHRYFVAAKRNEFFLGGATAQLRRLGAELAATPA